MTAILANGALPAHPVPLHMLAVAGTLVCCDGACRLARALGREPDYVVGDGDSLSQAEIQELGERYINVAEQDTNDLCKAFRFVLASLPPEPIVVLGATGLREDHAIANIAHLADFAEEFPDITLVTDSGVFHAVAGERTFACLPDESVSIFALRPGTRVESKGLRWPLAGVSLDSLWRGTLNATTGESFWLRTSQTILVFRPHPASVQETTAS